MKTDEEFHGRVMAEKNVARRLTLVKKEKYDFSAEDLKAVQDELSGRGPAGETEGQFREIDVSSCCNGFDGCQK